VKPPKTSTLAHALHGFFTDYLPQQRALSLTRCKVIATALNCYCSSPPGKAETPVNSRSNN